MAPNPLPSHPQTSEVKHLISSHNALDQSRQQSSLAQWAFVHDWQRLGSPWVALAIQVAVVIFLIVVIPVDLWIAYPHRFISANRTCYTFGLTVLAVVIPVFTLAQIRSLRLQGVVKNTGNVPKSRAHLTQVFLEPVSWRHEFTILPLLLGMLMLILLYSAISHGLAATSVEIHYTHDTHLFDSDITPNSHSDCWNLSSSLQPGEIGWKYNQTHYMVANDKSEKSFCPNALAAAAHRAATQPPHVWTQKFHNGPHGTCMSVLGGEVHCSAAGSPLDSRQPCGIRGAFNCSQKPGPFDLSFSTLTACAPVLVKNPVICRVVDSNSFQATTESAAPHFVDGCEIRGANSTGSLSLQQSDGNALSACIDPDGAVGNAKLVVWSSETACQACANSNCDVAGDQGILDRLVYDEFPPHEMAARSVSCQIDPAEAAYEYRIVEYVEGDTWSRVQSEGIHCDPRRGQAGNVALKLSPAMAATATATLLQFLDKNVTLPRQLYSLSDVGDAFDDYFYHGGWRHGIAGSSNVMEDVLGSLLAYGLALYHGHPFDSLASIEDESLLYCVNYTATAERIGSGKWIAIVYILPSLLSVGVLVHLLLLGAERDRAKTDDKSL